MRYLRKKRGWNQTDLGEKVGVTKQQIGHVERGHFPSTKVLFNLISVFDIPRQNIPDFLFEDISKVDKYFPINPPPSTQEPSEEYSRIEEKPNYSLEDLTMLLHRMQEDIRKLKEWKRLVENSKKND